MGEKPEWFNDLNRFQQDHTMNQVRFKEECLKVTEDGVAPWNRNKTYPHILPKSCMPPKAGKRSIFELAFNPDYALRIKSYFENGSQNKGATGANEASVALHSQIRNLRSSQACCVNVMVPLQHDASAALSVLKPYLPGATEVTSIEFEYIDAMARDAAGEKTSGSRGVGMTSFDLAIEWSAGARNSLMLCEWKYTENTFGACSGFTSKSNPNKEFCKNRLAREYISDYEQCYLHSKGRKYWPILEQLNLDWSCLRDVEGCPFSGRLNQLLRQQIMAECIKQSLQERDSAADVSVALIRPKCNHYVVGSGRNLAQAGESVVDIVNSLFKGEVLREIHVESIVDGMRKIHSPHMKAAVSYISCRYGFRQR